MKKLSEIIFESEEVGNLGFSSAEMVADYETMDDYPEMSKKKAIAAKYKIDSKKADEIKKAIVNQIRFERNTRKKFTDDDVKWFFRMDIPERYDKIEPILKQESPEFIKYLMEFYKVKLEKSKVFNYRTFHNRRDIRMTPSERHMCALYLNFEKYLDSIDEKSIEAKKIQNDVNAVIKATMLEQMKDFHDKYIAKVKDDAKWFWEKLPELIKRAKKYYDEAVKANNKYTWRDKEYKTTRQVVDECAKTYNGYKLTLSKHKTLSNYTEYMVDMAEKRYDNNVNALVERIRERDMDNSNLKVTDVKNDPKFYAMVVTDGDKKINCRSIWAAENSELVRAHYRFIMTNKK